MSYFLKGESMKGVALVAVVGAILFAGLMSAAPAEAGGFGFAQSAQVVQAPCPLQAQAVYAAPVQLQAVQKIQAVQQVYVPQVQLQVQQQAIKQAVRQPVRQSVKAVQAVRQPVVLKQRALGQRQTIRQRSVTRVSRF
jgi:hypothetical protein